MSHGASPSDIPEQRITSAIGQLLEGSELHSDERLHALASAFVVEALRPYWPAHRTAAEARDALCLADPEVANVLATLAPMLIGRIQAREDGQTAVAAAESMLGISR
ncbi:MAG: hypothetical protein WD942_02195 [Dehalococcoidia bacterium]